MKKLFTLLLTALLSLTTVNAQPESKVGMSEPNLVQEFLNNYVITLGVSADGQYIYGSVGGDVQAGIYNIKTNDPMIILDPELNTSSLGVNIAGITYDGIAFVSENNISYLYNIKDNTRTDLISPSPEIGMDIWDVSSDGKIFAGNITNVDGFHCEPIYGVKQEDGTYKMNKLNYDSNDAMGCIAQFTQARFVSEDGKYVMGLQVDSRGMAPRMVVWVLQEDGTYKFTTPLDAVIYDLSCKQPGEVPDYYDYVTADPDTEPELWQQQRDVFQKAFNDFEVNYGNFTRHSSLKAFMMNRAIRDSKIYTGIEEMIATEGSDIYDAVVTHPIIYDCEKDIVTYDKENVGTAFEQLPGGGYISFDDSSQLFYKTSVTKKDGTRMEFTKWLLEFTGIDLYDYFHYVVFNPLTGGSLDDVYAGLPYFSHDGKTLVLYGTNADYNFATNVLTFDRDVFDEVSTGINDVKVLCSITYSDNIITLNDGKCGTVELYGLNGVKQGAYRINGSLNLKSLVAAGSYIAKVTTNDNVTSTIKVIVK